ncbi:MAG: ABC transporter substrate-binding protein [Treponema sp.]|nr:ABC transporter substrate-binding protein [Treponema sp.]
MIKTIRNSFFILFFIFLIAFFPAAAVFAMPSGERTQELVIYGIKGPSGLGLVQLFENPVAVPGFTVKMEALAQADLAAARFISGEAKIGILPPNAAAKIAASGINIKVAAVTGMGMISLLTSDPDVNNIQDLKGKSIEAAGQGATPEFLIRAILKNNGLNPETDVKMGFSLAYPEIAQSIAAGRISTALLPEPFATQALTAGPSLRQVGDIRQEWQNLTGTDNYPMTVLAVNGDFAAANRDAVNIVLSDIEKSIKWTVANPEQAGLLAQKYDLGFPVNAAAAAIPKSNYVYIPADKAKSSLEDLFRIFLEYSPISIGGRLPNDDFYFK